MPETPASAYPAPVRQPMPMPPEEEIQDVEYQIPPPETVEEEIRIAIDNQTALARMFKTRMEQLNAMHAMNNIAEMMDRETLDKIGRKCVDGYDNDKRSREDWEERNVDVFKLAKLVAEERTWAGAQMHSVMYPLIAQAAISFNARAYPSIVRGTEVVKFNVIGKDDEGFKASRGERVAEHMNWQMLNEIPDWEAGMDQLLMTVPVVGTCFKKTYYSHENERIESQVVFPRELVVDQNCRDVETARRVTHEVWLYKNDVVERVRSGLFVGIDVDKDLSREGDYDQHSSTYADSTTQQDASSSPVREPEPEEVPHLFLEQHRYLDLDEDGYEEPYIVMVHWSSKKTVRITARYDLDSVKKDGDTILKIDPVQYFTKYFFLPDPEGCFYEMGFGTLLHPLNESINTIINLLLDAGMLSNFQGGYLGGDLQIARTRGGNSEIKFAPGEWKQVKARGVDLKSNIVPLPVREPSMVLFNLLEFLVNAGKELAAQTEVLAGNSPGANVPASTTLALIEQGLKVYTAIYKRLYRSLLSEIKKIIRLNRMYLPEEKYYQILDMERAVKKADYYLEDVDIVPVADPANASDTAKILKAEALLRLIGQGFNDYAIKKRYLQALQIEDASEILPPEEMANKPTPQEELAMMEAKAKIDKLNTQSALLAEKINTEKISQQVKAAGPTLEQEKLKVDKARLMAETQKMIADNNRKAEEVFVKAKGVEAKKDGMVKEPLAKKKVTK